MVQGIEGDPSPKERVEYQKEFHESVSLFSKALNEYHSSKEVHKKVVLKDVMSKALQAMGDSAAALVNKELIAEKKKLETDFHNYTTHETASGYQKLQEDLEEIQE
ncbi:MAG: hypothetical protein K9M07_07825 [Simkaniaceae bacterium]|nr:hypothetical protein [Simkaniaceae bacterium]MCF7853127.1 hypothetical protein [Simkaniaceae bacterium]